MQSLLQSWTGGMSSANVMSTMSQMATGVHSYAQSAVSLHSNTVQSLVHAIQKMDPVSVEHLLHAGVNVNEPVDREGHTALDCYAAAHTEMMKAIVAMRCTPEQKTQCFLTSMQRAQAVLDLLVSHNAQMSSPDSTRNLYNRQYIA
mmetsp:Transcript_3114/g.4783  ORF Transcript_3114/g.4783 Transcript_3114/m.4783 type:complete len:146 (+) Transcript_3114:65-502(+)